MAGACAFDVDENVAARSSNVARPPREGAATLQPASADLGAKAGVAGWRSGPFAAGESGRNPRGEAEGAGQGIVAAKWCSVEAPGRQRCPARENTLPADVADPQHAPDLAGPRPG